MKAVRLGFVVVVAVMLYLGSACAAGPNLRQTGVMRFAPLFDRLPSPSIVELDHGTIALLARNSRLRLIPWPSGYGVEHAVSPDGSQIAAVVYTDDWAREGGLSVYENGKWGPYWYVGTAEHNPVFVSPDEIVMSLGGFSIVSVLRPTWAGPSEPEELATSESGFGEVTAYSSDLLAATEVNPESYQVKRLVIIKDGVRHELPWGEVNEEFMNLSFSADGSRLLYRVWEQEVGTTNILQSDAYALNVADVVDAEEPQYGTLLKEDVLNPAWLPDLDGNRPDGDPDSDGIAWAVRLSGLEEPDSYRLWMQVDGQEPVSRDFDAPVTAIFPFVR